LLLYTASNARAMDTILSVTPFNSRPTLVSNVCSIKELLLTRAVPAAAFF
jgi:hypothetical protein